jgi:hypothetical protein
VTLIKWISRPAISMAFCDAAPAACLKLAHTRPSTSSRECWLTGLKQSFGGGSECYRSRRGKDAHAEVIEKLNEEIGVGGLPTNSLSRTSYWRSLGFTGFARRKTSASQRDSACHNHVMEHDPCWIGAYFQSCDGRDLDCT